MKMVPESSEPKENAKILKTAFYPIRPYLLIVPVNGLKFPNGLFMCQINEIPWTFKLANKKCSTYYTFQEKLLVSGQLKHFIYP